MSGSYRHTPIFGHASAKSEAEWKAKAARKMRRKVRASLAEDPTTATLPSKAWETSNPWDGPKDGKHWWSKAQPRHMRK